MSILRAKLLRKNLTPAERKLWSALRRKMLDGARFRRQHPLGPFVVDFVYLEKKLIVELDGDQHGWDENQIKDARRTQWLEARGYRVLRFWNHEVFENLEGVLLSIQETLKDPMY